MDQKRPVNIAKTLYYIQLACGRKIAVISRVMPKIPKDIEYPSILNHVLRKRNKVKEKRRKAS